MDAASHWTHKPLISEWSPLSSLPERGNLGIEKFLVSYAKGGGWWNINRILGQHTTQSSTFLQLLSTKEGHYLALYFFQGWGFAYILQSFVQRRIISYAFHGNVNKNGKTGMWRRKKSVMTSSVRTNFAFIFRFVYTCCEKKSISPRQKWNKRRIPCLNPP